MHRNDGVFSGRANCQGHATTNTWYLNLNDPMTWTSGPELSQGRGYLSCSLISWPSPQIVIVGGGDINPDGLSKKTDIIDLKKNSAVQGPDLPKYLSGHTQ